MTRGDWMGMFDIYQMIFWCVVYIECIRIGVRQRTYCMPLLAICMNFCWEALSFVDCVIHVKESAFMYVHYGTWLLLDIGIISTFVLYHKEEAQKFAKGLVRTLIERCFWGVLMLVVAVILFMYFFIPTWKGYFAYADNLIMSALFIVMLYLRKGSRGQSMSIAVIKCMGTLCATMTMILNGSYDLFAMGIGCFVLDVAYIILLYRTIQTEKAIVRLPKRKKSKA